jgi:NAD-dependent SIR2 family protein deacetylase
LWITAEVDLPNQVLDAQQSSRLVVFVGAGISVDAPSNMPSFPRLVEILADEAGERAPDWGDVPSDVFLGRIERDGFRVHDRAARLVTPSGSQAPNRYHESILGLFRNPESVRIVTTNHDPFLTIAAQDVFDEAVESLASREVVEIRGGLPGWKSP